MLPLPHTLKRKIQEDERNPREEEVSMSGFLPPPLMEGFCISRCSCFLIPFPFIGLQYLSKFQIENKQESQGIQFIILFYFLLACTIKTHNVFERQSANKPSRFDEGLMYKSRGRNCKVGW